MFKTIKVPEDIRTLVRPSEGTYLYATNDYLEKGTEVEVGRPQRMEYDHRMQLAVPFVLGGVKRWLLVGELGLTCKR